MFTKPRLLARSPSLVPVASTQVVVRPTILRCAPPPLASQLSQLLFYLFLKHFFHLISGDELLLLLRKSNIDFGWRGRYFCEGCKVKLLYLTSSNTESVEPQLQRWPHHSRLVLDARVQQRASRACATKAVVESLGHHMKGVHWLNYRQVFFKNLELSIDADLLISILLEATNKPLLDIHDLLINLPYLSIESIISLLCPQYLQPVIFKLLLQRQMVLLDIFLLLFALLLQECNCAVELGHVVLLLIEVLLHGQDLVLELLCLILKLVAQVCLQLDYLLVDSGQ